MTEAELISRGFKKKKFGDAHWYELNARKHRFLTNDSPYPHKKKNQGKWFVGYENKVDSEEVFWFNQNLYDPKTFDSIHHLLTGKYPIKNDIREN